MVSSALLWTLRLLRSEPPVRAEVAVNSTPLTFHAKQGSAAWHLSLRLRPPPPSGALSSARISHIMDQGAWLAAALESGSRAEREAAYELVAAKIGAGVAGPVSRDDATALAVAFAPPLVAAVLSAPASKVDLEEWRRASLLLVEMCRLDTVAVCGVLCIPDEPDSATPRIIAAWEATDSVLAEMLNKDPSRWDTGDAITASMQLAYWAALFEVGATACVDRGVEGVERLEKGVEGWEMTFCTSFVGTGPYTPIRAAVPDHPRPASRAGWAAGCRVGWRLDALELRRDKQP